MNYKHTLDLGAWAFAGLAAMTFWQGVALGVTILAASASFVLACYRIHDRIKYGPSRSGDVGL